MSDSPTTIRQTSAPLSDEEKSLIGKQGELLQLQIDEFKRNSEQMIENFPAAKELINQVTQAQIQGVMIERQRLTVQSGFAGEAMAQAAEMIGVVGPRGAAWATQEQIGTYIPKYLRWAAENGLNPDDPTAAQKFTDETKLGARVGDPKNLGTPGVPGVPGSVDPNDPALREAYTKETGVGAQAGDRNQDAIARETGAGVGVTQKFLDWAAAKSGTAAVPAGAAPDLGKPIDPSELFNRPGGGGAISFGEDGRVNFGGCVAGVGGPGGDELDRVAREVALSSMQQGAIPLTAAERANIAEAFKFQETEGMRLLKEAGENAASARGFRLSDSPGARPYLDNVGRLSAALGSARAGTELEMGVRTQAARTAASDFQRQFKESIRQFNEGLKQQAFTNRLALTGSGVNPGGIATGSSGNPNATIGSALNFLNGRPRNSTTTSPGNTASTVAGGAAAAGSLALGTSALANSSLGSWLANLFGPTAAATVANTANAGLAL